MGSKYNWGFDLGGTKIEGVVLDQNNQVVVRKRVPTGADQGYKNVLNQVEVLIDQLADDVNERPSAIGIGTPGSIDPETGLLKNCNSQAINGNPFLKDLKSKLDIDITMVNDANCFALAEAVMGSVPEQFPDAQVVFGVIMGSGVGGGIVVNNRIINGKNGNSGEWGHSFLDESGGKCYCGNTGCVELLLAGPHLERYYASISDKTDSLKNIYSAYKNNSDEHAVNTIKRLIHFFGKGIANIINILDPDVIVIGGGVSNLDVLYNEGVEEVKKFVFNPRLNTPIIPPKLGDSAGVFGAALLNK